MHCYMFDLNLSSFELLYTVFDRCENATPWGNHEEQSTHWLSGHMKMIILYL